MARCENDDPPSTQETVHEAFRRASKACEQAIVHQAEVQDDAERIIDQYWSEISTQTHSTSNTEPVGGQISLPEDTTLSISLTERGYRIEILTPGYAASEEITGEINVTDSEREWQHWEITSQVKPHYLFSWSQSGDIDPSHTGQTCRLNSGLTITRESKTEAHSFSFWKTTAVVKGITYSRRSTSEMNQTEFCVDEQCDYIENDDVTSDIDFPTSKTHQHRFSFPLKLNQLAERIAAHARWQSQLD